MIPGSQIQRHSSKSPMILLKTGNERSENLEKKERSSKEARGRIFFNYQRKSCILI